MPHEAQLLLDRQPPGELDMAFIHEIGQRRDRAAIGQLHGPQRLAIDRRHLLALAQVGVDRAPVLMAHLEGHALA